MRPTPRASRPAAPPEVSPPAKLTGRDVVILAALGLVALAVRAPRLSQSFWFDELMYSRLFFGVRGQLDWLLWKDVHPPLYPLLLWGYWRVFGDGEVTLRLPSLVFGLGSLAGVYALSLRWFGRRVAWVSAGFLALSPVHAWYSVENKVNMLALFLSVMVFLSFAWWAEAPGRWRRGGVAILLAILALGTHAFAVATIGAVGIWLSWRALRDRALRPLAAVAAGILVGGWGPLAYWKLATQAGTLARPYLRPLDAGELYKLLFVWFPHGNTLRTIPPYSPWSRLAEQPWPYFLVDGVAASLSLLGLWAAVRGALPGRRDPWPHRLLLLWLLPPLVGTMVASWFIPRFYIERNLLGLLPAYGVLWAVGLETLPRGVRRWGATAVALALGAVGLYFLHGPKAAAWTVYKPKPDWRGAAAWIQGELATRGALAVITTTPPLALEYYVKRPKAGGLTIVDYCARPVALADRARRWAGNLVLVQTHSWKNCWESAWQQAQTRGSPQLVLRGEHSFRDLTLHDFRVAQ